MDQEKQIAIALLCECENGHDLYSGLSRESDVVRGVAKNPPVLTKADFFDTIHNGKSVFHFRETWKHFDRIYKAIRAGGDDIAPKDFLRKGWNGKHILNLCADVNMLGSLFAPHIWKGRDEEMEDLWYWVHTNDRRRHDTLALRRVVANASGKKLREDRLIELGIALADMRKAFFTGEFAAVNAKLHPAGDYVRVEDALLAGDVGETPLHSGMPWNHFDKIAKELSRNGEYFKKNDFLKTRGEQDHLLGKTTGFKDLHRVFHVSVWAGRPHEMLELFDMVKPEDTKNVPIHNAVADVAATAYPAVDVAKASHAALLKPFANNPRDPGKTAHTFRPLGLQTTWSNIDDIRAALAAKGEKLTLADLRLPHGHGDETVLRAAVRYGYFEKIQAILVANGEKLAKEDLLKKSHEWDNNIVELLAQRAQLQLLLKPAMWAGKGQEMLDVIAAIPEVARKEIDVPRLLGEVNRLSVRQKFGPRP